MPKLNHNKRRNVGLVYEFLTREVTQSVIDRSSRATLRAAEALDIIAKHLGPGSVLEEELALHQSVMEARGASPTLARRIVDELRAAGIRLAGSAASRDAAKTALIHEINRRLGREVFDNRVADYTAHASVGILLARGLGRLDEGVDLARVEEHLMAFLSSPPDTKMGSNPDATLHTYQTALQIFEEEYGRSLMPQQAALLRENVRVALGGPREPLERLFQKQKSLLRRELQEATHDEAFKADEKMRESLNEAILAIPSIEPTEEGVERLMLYWNLVREIESK